MSFVPKNKYEVPPDAPQYVHDLMEQLRGDLHNISIATKQQKSATTVISDNVQAIADTSTASTVAYRTGIKILSVGSNYVPFSTGIGTNTYHLIIEIYALDGTQIPQSTISSNIPQTSSGFTVTTTEAAVIKYTAIPLK